jgi:hypothetical protein
MKKYFIFLAVVASSVIFSSCAKVPQVEIDAAVAALEQAKVAQADVYLESEFMALQDSLSAVNTEIEAQKSKMFASYGDAKLKLAAIAAQSSELVGKTETRKQEVKTEVVQAQAEVASLMEENLAMVEKAPKGKEGKEAIEAIKSDLAAISATAAEIPALMESNEFLAAQTKVNAVKQKATEINAELKTVFEKVGKK